MGEIQIQKIQRTVQVKDGDNKRKKVQKTYGKIIYRKTLSLDDMAEHIMKHGSVYTEDVVIGVITKLKSCMQEMLADGHKVKLDGIGTLYPTLTSEGVEDAKDYSPSENVTRVGIAFLADQSRKSMYKARYMRDTVNLSTKLYSELTTSPQPSPNVRLAARMAIRAMRIRTRAATRTRAVVAPPILPQVAATRMTREG